jgi:hypothetical protein
MSRVSHHPRGRWLLTKSYEFAPRDGALFLYKPLRLCDKEGAGGAPNRALGKVYGPLHEPRTRSAAAAAPGGYSHAGRAGVRVRGRWIEARRLLRVQRGGLVE